jgi:hypothetical protein
MVLLISFLLVVKKVHQSCRNIVHKIRIEKGARHIGMQTAKKVSRGGNIAPPDTFRRVALPQHHQNTL